MERNKCAVITGVGGSFGSAIVETLIANDWFVHGCDINQLSLVKLEQQFSKESFKGYCIDVTKQKAVKDFFESLALDSIPCRALVNNAGILLGRNLEEYEQTSVERVLQINLCSALYCSQQFANYCSDAQITCASLVNIGSVSALSGSHDVLYGASKAALEGLTRSLAVVLAPKIVLVHLIGSNR